MEDMEIAPGAVQTGQSERGQPEKKNCSRRTEDWVDLKAVNRCFTPYTGKGKGRGKSESETLQPVDRMSFWTRGSPDSLWGTMFLIWIFLRFVQILLWWMLVERRKFY